MYSSKPYSSKPKYTDSIGFMFFVFILSISVGMMLGVIYSLSYIDVNKDALPKLGEVNSIMIEGHEYWITHSPECKECYK